MCRIKDAKIASGAKNFKLSGIFFKFLNSTPTEILICLALLGNPGNRTEYLHPAFYPKPKKSARRFYVNLTSISRSENSITVICKISTNWQNTGKKYRIHVNLTCLY